MESLTTGDLTFDEMVDMYHTLSINVSELSTGFFPCFSLHAFRRACQAPRLVKVHTAFRLYDFDGDKYVGRSDIETLLKTLTLHSRERCVVIMERHGWN